MFDPKLVKELNAVHDWELILKEVKDKALKRNKEAGQPENGNLEIISGPKDESSDNSDSKEE
jgi:hypothetical protein